jgi:aminopeptidase N
MKRIVIFCLVAALVGQGCKTGKLSNDQPEWDFGNILDTIEVSGKPKEYRASEKRNFDLLHTKLQVSFSWEKQHLYGKANLMLKPYFYESNLLVLDAKGFDINKVVLVNSNQTFQDLKFEYKDSLKLHIQLPKVYTRKDTFEIFIDYTAKPNELQSGGSNAITSDKGLYFINPLNKDANKPQQIWTQGETEASSCWFPTIDKPNERCTAEICITVSDSLITLSNGLLTESSVLSDGTKTECWTMDQPHAPYLFMMAIGKYSVVKDKWRGKEVSYYVEPDYEKYARNIFGNTPEMLEFFSQKLGVEYPWQKYAQVVVRDFVSGAMENTSASLFLEQIQSNNRERLDRNWDFIIAHELFHQWFGDYVTCESWSNITLNEAFATYSEYLWNEHKYGKDEADYNLMGDLKKYLGEARIYQEPLIRFHYKDKEEVFDSHSYEKGGLILHMLRNYLGDEAFFKSLELYLKNHAYTSVEAHNLRMAFEEVTGEDLNWFFNQWFLSSGHPKLKITYSYIDSTKKQIINIEQQRSNDNTVYFRLPLQVDIYTAEGITRKEILVNDKKHTFEFDVATKPKLINVDAAKILVCEKDDSKTNDEWIYQFYNAPLVIDKHEALNKLAGKQDSKQEVKDLFIAATKAPHWSVREVAVNKLFLDDSLSRSSNFELLKSVALKDEKSQVRHAAIKRLSNYQKEEQLKIYEQTIGDSSYLVASKTLKAIYEIDTTKALSLAAHLETENVGDVIDAVGSIYAGSGEVPQQKYFEEKLNSITGNAVYYLINDYATFLTRMDNSLLPKGAATIKNIAMHNDNWYLRSEAGIAIHDVLEDIQDKLKEKKELLQKEKDATVKAEIENAIVALEPFAASLKDDFETITTSETNKKAQERYKKFNTE